MSIRETRIALNPLQFFASPDGWLDPSSAPPLETRLQIIAESGFTAIQPETPADGDAVSYLETLDRYGLSPGPGYARAVWSADAVERRHHLDEAGRAAAAHAELGVELVFFTTGMFDDTTRTRTAAVGADFDADRLARIAEHVEEAGAVMRSEGVKPLLHPHVGTWIETETEARYVLDHTDPAIVGFGPDIGHLAWAGADYLGLIRDYRDRIEGIHLKDFDASVADDARQHRRSYREAVTRGLWKEPGYGDCDFAALETALDPDHRLWSVIEVDYPAAPSARESIARCAAWVFS